MDLFQFVGQRIRDLRLSYGGGELSQEALARALKVAPNTISRWETATNRPNLADLDMLARFFGVSILTFFSPEQGERREEVAALLRAAQQLSPEDITELRRYAEFRRARSLYEGGEKPRPGRKRKAQ